MVLERRPASPGPLSLVVAATVTRDNLEAMQPTREGDAEEHPMSEEERPLLHTELRLDGCIKPDGKSGRLKSLNIFVEDDDDASQSRPGSPQRTISVTMCDKDFKRSYREGRRSDLRNDDGREVRPGRQKLLRRKSNVVVDTPFSVHNHQIRLSGKQPQGLAAALTDARPEVLPALKEPKGLKAVLYLDSLANEDLSDQEMPEGRTLDRRQDEEGRDDTGSTSMGRDGLLDQEQTSPFQQHGTSEVLDVCSYEYDSEENSHHPDDIYSYSKDRKQVESKYIASPKKQVSEDSDDNLRILETLPKDLVSSLVKTQSKRFTASECGESEREDEAYRQTYSQKAARDEFRTNEAPGSSWTDPRRSVAHQEKASNGKSRSRPPEPSRKESELSETSLRRSHDPIEELKGANEAPKSVRDSKQLRKNMGAGTSSSCSTSTACGDDSKHDGGSRSHRKTPKRVLEGMSEEQEVHREGILPPSQSEKGKDSQRRPRKMTKGPESLRSPPLDLSVDGDGSRRGTYSRNSYTDSHQGRGLRDRMDMINSRAQETEEKMLSISRLLENMSSVTQMLNNFPQPLSGEIHQAWNQQTSRDFQVDGGSMSRPPQQFQIPDTNWHFARDKHPSQLLHGGASQANETPYDSSHQAQFFDGRPPEQSTADNLQSQVAHGGLSQMNIPDSHFQQFSRMNDHPSSLLGTPLSHPGLQRDGSTLLGSMNQRFSRLHYEEDPLQQPEGMNRQHTQLLVQRPSQPYGVGDSCMTEIRPSLNTRPSQVGSQDKDMELFDTMSNRASQLAVAQQQTRKLSKLKAFQQKKGNDNSWQTLPKNGRQSQIQNDSSAQLKVGTLGIRESASTSGSLNHSRASQLDPQGTQLLVAAMNARQSQGRVNTGLLQKYKQDSESQQADDRNTRSSQNVNMRFSQSNPQDGSLPQFEDTTVPVRQSQLLNTRISQMNLTKNDPQGSDGQASQLLNNRSSQMMSTETSKLADTRVSHSNMQGDHQIDNVNPNSQDGNLREFEDLNSQSSQFLTKRNLPEYNLKESDGQASRLLNNRPSRMTSMGSAQLVDSRPSHLNVLGDWQITSLNPNPENASLQQFDDMMVQPSQLLNTRRSQMNLTENHPQEFYGRESQVLSNKSSQKMNMGSLQLLDARPSHSNVPDDQQMNLPETGSQEFGGQSTQLLNTRSSQMRNARSSQLLDVRSSQSNVLGDQQVEAQKYDSQDFNLPQFNDMNIRSSQLLNARTSNMNLRDNGRQKSDGQPSQLLNNKPFQMLDMRPSQLFDSTRTSTSNMQNNQQIDRPSLLLDNDSHRPSQAKMFYNGLQAQYDQENSRPSLFESSRPSQMNNMQESQFLDKRISQADMQPNDDLQQYGQNTIEFQISLTSPSQDAAIQEGDKFQQYNPSVSTRLSEVVTQEDDGSRQYNPRQSQLANTRLSQSYHREGDDQQLYDGTSPTSNSFMNIRPSQIDTRPSQVIYERPTQMSLYDDNQRFNPVNSRQSQVLDLRASQMPMQGDDFQQLDPMNPRQSQVLYDDNQRFNPVNSRQSQVLELRASQMPMQGDDFQQLDPMNPRQSQVLNARLSQIGMQDDNFQQFESLSPRQSQMLNDRPSQIDMQDENFQQSHYMSNRPSQLSSIRPSQGEFQNVNMQDFDPSSQSQYFDPDSSQRASTLQPEAMPMYCDNCFEYDHVAVNCSTQECLNCEQPGHYARFCIEENAAEDATAEYETDPRMQQEGEGDMPHDQEYDTGDYNIDSENTAQMQRDPTLMITLLQQTSDNAPSYLDAKLQQSTYQPIPYGMIQQLRFPQLENLRRSLAQTVSNMLEEVKELEARSQRNSVIHLQKPMASQSRGVSRNPELAKTDKPEQSCSSGGVKMAYQNELQERTSKISPQELGPQITSPQRGTGRTSTLVEDQSWEEDLRKSRISQWLINLPTHYEYMDANKCVHFQDEFEQYVEASDLYKSP